MGTEPVTTLAEAARAAGAADQDSFKRMITMPSEKLSVLASGADSLLDDATSPEAFESILNRLMVTYPIVIADLSGATASVKRMVMHKAHEVVIVTAPTLPALRSARSLRHEIKEVRGGSDKEVELVVNMKDQAPGLEVSLPDITAAIGCKPFLSIPFLPKLFATAETQGRKLGEVSGSEAIVTGLITLARKVIQAEEVVQTNDKADGNFLGGLLGKLKVK
jgi:pilus assembly protein CpaE